jgi:hypothetical protein
MVFYTSDYGLSTSTLQEATKYNDYQAGKGAMTDKWGNRL